MGYSIDPISANCYPDTTVLINKFELLPVKRTMKKIKFSRPVAQAAGRFLCSKEKIVLLKGRKNAQVTLHTAIVVIADVIGDHLNQFLFACETLSIITFAL